jgi:predicted secreted Zn-dependent protease
MPVLQKMFKVSKATDKKQKDYNQKETSDGGNETQ